MTELQTLVENEPLSELEPAAKGDSSSDTSEGDIKTDPTTESDADTDNTEWDNVTETGDSDESDDYEPRR